MTPGLHAGSALVNWEFSTAFARLIRTTATTGTNQILLSCSVSLLGLACQPIVSARSIIYRQRRHARPCVQAKGSLEHSSGMSTRRQPGKSHLGASGFPSPWGYRRYEEQSEPASGVIKSKGSPDCSISSGCRRPEPRDLTDIRAWPEKVERGAKKSKGILIAGGFMGSDIISSFVSLKDFLLASKTDFKGIVFNGLHLAAVIS